MPIDHIFKQLQRFTLMDEQFRRIVCTKELENKRDNLLFFLDKVLYCATLCTQTTMYKLYYWFPKGSDLSQQVAKCTN